MDHANLKEDHIPLLFFIAESVMYRICCDVDLKSHLCSREIKLAKFGFLTLLRLFVFHTCGQLHSFEDHKKRLSTYLKALPACEATYRPYPNVLSSIHVMLKIGETICALEPPSETQTSSPNRSTSSATSSESEKDVDINPFVWHCILIWVHVQINSPYMNKVIQSLSLFEEGLCQENWLDSLLALFILGEAAKLNLSCLMALMELAQNFIYPQHLQAQQSSSISLGRYSNWPWEVVYTYITVLADICLHGSTSEIQKHAFIGFQDGNSSPTEQKEASLHGLLFFNSGQMKNEDYQTMWVIPYGAVYNLVKVCHELHWDVNRDGLRNAIWKALYKHGSTESDLRIIEAVKVAEAEVNGPTNPFISTSAKASSGSVSLAFSQHLGQRLANALSHCFLPPIEPYIHLPRKPVMRQLPRKLPELKENSLEKTVTRLSIRQERVPAETSFNPHPQFITRTSMDLKKVIEDQWSKELQIRVKQDEEMLNMEQKEKQKKDEERLKEIMKKREQKLNKTSKPYELPVTKNNKISNF
ncbi:transmembrane protein 232 [Discoglossus pictus]